MSRKHTVLASIIGFLAGALVCLLVIVFIFPVRVPRTANVYKVDESSGVTGQQLTDMALEAAGYLKTGNFQALSELVHPDYGLIFSPFATVNLSTNLCFSVKELPGLGESTEKLVWGVHTDGGEPISMTVQEYMKEFVFDRDYTAAPLIGVNYTIRTGNALENVSDSFPGASFVDLCYPGTAEAEYTDWSTLRLVFEEHDGELSLTCVIHSEAVI